MIRLDECTEQNAQIPKYKNKVVTFILNIIESEKFPFLILFFAMIILHRFIMMVSDDFWFAKMSGVYSFKSYILLRYATWTGRVSVEGVLYYILKDNGTIWRLINPMVITLLAFSISRITLGKNVLNKKNHRRLNWFICLGWLYIGKDVLYGPVFWMTGSINYLWTMTAALFALIPFRDAVMKEYNYKLNIPCIILAVFAAMGQEQSSLILMAFSIIIVIYIYVREKKVYKYLIIQTIFVVLGSLALFLAPGNAARVNSEINTWLPNYHLYTRWEFAFNGIQWFLDSLINHSRLIFLLILSIVWINVHKKYKGITNGVFTLVPLVGSIVIIIAMFFLVYVNIPDSINNWIHFPQVYYTFGNKVKNLLFNFNSPFNLYTISTLKYIVWIVLMLLMPFYIVAILGLNFKSFYIALIYLAGICSVLVIFVSPTMYVSGDRTLFPLGILFLMTFILLLKNMQQLLKVKYIILFSIVPIYAYILLLLKFGVL